MELRIPLEGGSFEIAEGILAAFGGDEPWLAGILANGVEDELEQYAAPNDGAGYELIDDCASNREEGLKAIRHFIALGWLDHDDLRRYEREHPAGRESLSEHERGLLQVKEMEERGLPPEDIESYRQYVEHRRADNERMKAVLTEGRAA